jgi:hypothetical protein
MNSPGDGQPVLYKVIPTGVARRLLKQRHLEAIQTGRGAPFLAAFRQIIERLRKEPLVFGEPLYRLKALQLEIRQGIVLPLVVDYAVDEQRRLVYIRGCKVLP